MSIKRKKLAISGGLLTLLALLAGIARQTACTYWPEVAAAVGIVCKQ